MKLAAIFRATFFSGALLLSRASAQTPSPEPAKTFDAAQLEALAKKIDEQNAKIDALSQEILKLEQQISHTIRDRYSPREMLILSLNQITRVELTPDMFD